MRTRLLRDVRGVSAIEFALIAPTLLLLIFGLIQVGIMFNAQTGLRHAVAEGARYATLWPNPTDEQIRARVTDRRFGMNPALITGPTVTRGMGGPDGNFQYVELTMTYNMPINFFFVSLPSVPITETRRAYFQ